jgi:hypothetical protein
MIYYFAWKKYTILDILRFFIMGQSFEIIWNNGGNKFDL